MQSTRRNAGDGVPYGIRLSFAQILRIKTAASFRNGSSQLFFHDFLIQAC